MISFKGKHNPKEATPVPYPVMIWQICCLKAFPSAAAIPQRTEVAHMIQKIQAGQSRWSFFQEFAGLKRQLRPKKRQILSVANQIGVFGECFPRPVIYRHHRQNCVK